MKWHKDEYTIITDKSKMDVTVIHEFLSNSYWAKGIPVDTVQKSIDGALCFGVFHGEQQIGFARVITDKATFAYLADVFIIESCRGKGLSKWLMEIITSHPELQGLRRFLLATRDAHGLYRQFGFTELESAENLMHVYNPDVYKMNS
jgi:N-acetylglutamate synthase-like GNAT family acetyltransferase